MTNDTTTKLLARVKELREALGLSQEKFAEKAGIGYKYYQHVEAGRRRDVRLSTLEKLAKACGLQLRDLFDFDTSPSALAEDEATYGAKKPCAKRARKSSKRPPHNKGA